MSDSGWVSEVVNSKLGGPLEIPRLRPAEGIA